MIVKIQQSLFQGGKKVGMKPRMLIYNKNRKYVYEDEITKEVEDLLKGRPKAYFNAIFHKKTGKLEINDEVETQNW